MNPERLGEIMSEFEAPDTQEARKTELLTELSDGFGSIIATQDKMKKELEATKEKNHQLQLKNSHYANRVASQYLDMEDKKEIIKKEEKKTRNVSDALKGL